MPKVSQYLRGASKMHKSRKRKQRTPSIESPAKSNGTHGVKLTVDDPFPDHPQPTPEECRAVRDDLLALHGFPKEFVKYRRTTADHPPNGSSSPSINGLEDQNQVKAEPLEPKESVLDGLVSTILSQNTTESNSQRAFASLKSSFPTWEDVACVLMFHLQQDDFPVDTHIFQIAKAMGWVPGVADTKKTYLHLNRRIPNELKFDLNCLLYTHGKLCQKCTRKGGNQQKKQHLDNDNSCPLRNYLKDTISVCNKR